MYKTDLKDWPLAVAHLSPGVGFFRMVCIICAHKWTVAIRPGSRSIGECPMCSCKQPEKVFPFPEQASGHDGNWIDPGKEPKTQYLN